MTDNPNPVPPRGERAVEGRAAAASGSGKRSDQIVALVRSNLLRYRHETSRGGRGPNPSNVTT
jgi:hypothetical protein